MSFALAEETVGAVTEQTSNAVAEGRLDLRGFGHIGESVLDAVLGYLVVFIGLFLLMVVIIAVGKVMVAKAKKADAKVAEPVAAAAVAGAVESAAAAAPKKLAPGSAGEVKLYDTDPRDAAMIMAIVADKLGKPLNELRFVSIKEVK